MWTPEGQSDHEPATTPGRGECLPLDVEEVREGCLLSVNGYFDFEHFPHAYARFFFYYYPWTLMLLKILLELELVLRLWDGRVEVITV